MSRLGARRLDAERSGARRGGATRVDVVYFEAGSGHRSAAMGLCKALERQPRGWRVRAVDAAAVFDHHCLFGPVVRGGIAWFNARLRREQVAGLHGLIGASLWCHYRLRRPGLRRLSRYWRDEPPDAVVSVTPMYNPALYGAARCANPGALCVTVPVDFEECRPGYWFTPFVEQHYLLSTPALMRQAAESGLPAGRLHRIGGMVIDPDFYDLPPIDRDAELVRLGLDPQLPTVLVSFGGQGSVLVRDVARSLVEAGPGLNAILLCGRHREVCRQLQAMSTPYRKAVLGYLPQSPTHLLRLADAMVGKPGSMTITEAVVLGRPLVALRAGGLRPVQRGNEEWLEARGVGRIAESPSAVGRILREVLADEGYRRRAEGEHHRGVFEAARIIADLVDAAEQGDPLAPAAAGAQA